MWRIDRFELDSIIEAVDPTIWYQKCVTANMGYLSHGHRLGTVRRIYSPAPADPCGSLVILHSGLYQQSPTSGALSACLVALGGLRLPSPSLPRPPCSSFIHHSALSRAFSIPSLLMPRNANGGTLSTIMSPLSPVSPSTSSWKKIFRPSSKRGRNTDSNPHLTLDTQHDFMTSSIPEPSLPAFDSHRVPSGPLTPASVNRYSFNSSDTRSTDSGRGRSQPSAPSAQSGDRSSSPSPSHHRQDRKPNKSHKEKKHKQAPPLTANSSQQSFKTGQTPPRLGGALSPRSVSASASRFIRRVASAPSTKNLLARDARHHSQQALRNGGLLSPSEVPPVPGLIPGTLGTTSEYYVGHSLDKIPLSKGLSRARANTSAQVKVISTKGLGLEAPGRAAFRRTYSSNSIKVGHVSHRFFDSWASA